MKIILINLRYFISGGPERYMFNIKEVLESEGHEVIPFSIQHDLNEPSEYSNYFLEKIGQGNEVYYKDYKKNSIKDIVHLFGRLFYSFEAKRKLGKLIRDTKPDLVYILYFENKISPSVIDAAKRKKIPVVLRISDFGLICAANIFYLKKEQAICERCLQHGKHHMVLNRCYHDSLIYSTLKYAAYKLHDLLHIHEKVDAYVIPSDFTKSKFIESGIPEQKIFRIPTFFNFKEEPGNLTYGDYALYIGRVDPDKGIKTLVDAFIDTPYTLKIVGFSSTDYDEYIQKYLEGKNHHIHFEGKKNFEEILHYLSDCRFTIVSSEWYDNFPNAIIESFAYKKAVIATNIGSLKELVEDGVTGLLFDYGSSKDLKQKATQLFGDEKLCQTLGEAGYEKARMEYSKEKHYTRLINLFKSLA